MPTWHEVKQVDSPLIALHLSKSSAEFKQFYDLLVSSLKVLRKYDRLVDRVGADNKTFLDELKVVRVRMEQVSVGVQLTTEPPPTTTNTNRRELASRLPPPPVPAKPTSPAEVQPPQHPRSRTRVPIPLSDQVSLPSVQ